MPAIRRPFRPALNAAAALLVVLVLWRPGEVAARNAGENATTAAARLTAFYDPPSLSLNARAGELLRAEPMDGGLPGARAYRLLYVTTGINGTPIASSGVAYLPDTPAAEPRPVVAWAHPTTGISRTCAPSLRDAALAGTIPGLAELIAAGNVVVATDYPGLGTPGTNAYLVGDAEGRAVLDSVRAVRALSGSGAGGAFAVFGHSQGGQAALFTGLLAARYAPELDLKGVVAAAPVTLMESALSASRKTALGRTIIGMTLASWSRVYRGEHLDERAILGRVPKPFADLVLEGCLETADDLARIERIAGADTGDLLGFTGMSLFNQAPWPGLLARNTAQPLPKAVPLFVLQGGEDDIVPAIQTRTYVERACADGRAVEVLYQPARNHYVIALSNGTAIAEWIAGRFADRPARDDCGKPW